MFAKAVIHLRILRHGTRIKLGINKHSLRIVRFYYTCKPVWVRILADEWINYRVYKKDELY